MTSAWGTLLLLLAAAAPAEDLTVLPAKLDGVPPAQMMREYLLRLAREATQRRAAEFEKVKTPEQIAAYQDRLRQFFLDRLGGLPPRTPLAPRVVGRIAGDGYVVEKVIYQSQPGHYVTAALYLPKRKPPFPGVLVPCGHSDNGKAAENYQRVSILLARNGLAALCYDPIDQGERFQLLDAKGVPLARTTLGHCLAGVGSILLGRNTATYRVWDGMRSLDYLESRPEIDPKRLGCTGNSGGGTLTAYLMALDPRIQVAAPSCYLTTLLRLAETIGPQDAEQNIHGQLAFGMDHTDYVLMRAPRPTLLCCATYDYFDIGGVWDTFRQAKRWYGRLGYPERVDLAEAEEKHGFSPLLRTAAVRWMRRWLLDAHDAIVETQTNVLSDKELHCTPKGQVMLLEGARSVYDLNRQLEDHLAEARRKRWNQEGRAAMLDEVRRLTGIRRMSELPLPQCQKTGVLHRPGYRIEKLILRPEPGIWLPALFFVPESRGSTLTPGSTAKEAGPESAGPAAKAAGAKKETQQKPASPLPPPADKAEGLATLYVHAGGKQADAAPGGPIEKLVHEGHVVLAVDLRGLGETQGGKATGFAKFLGPDWADVFLAYQLNKSYLAMRAEDILAAARFLAQDQTEKPRAVHLLAVGNTGPVALHAAVLEPQVFASVTLRRSVTSWAEVVRTPLARNQFANVVHGALRVYDLPDLAATLGDKLRWVEPVDATEQPLAKPSAEIAPRKP